jgi:hypothetical protein
MENYNEPEIEHEAEHEMQPLVITEDIRSYIYESAKWTKFLSIVGFIVTGLMVLIAISVGSVMQSMSEIPAYQGLAALSPGVITVFYLLIALVYFYPSFLMYKFSSAAKLAVLYGSQENLSLAMSKMKSIFKFWGILTIIIIAIYVLMIVGISIGAGIAASAA